MAARYVHCWIMSGKRVSILVLVDWRWRLAFEPSVRLGMRMFQSLFWWIGDGGHVDLALSVRAMKVSILVLVDWRWRPGISGQNASLSGVSILVLVDWRWRLCGKWVDATYGTFQSLFWWIGDGGDRRREHRRWPPREFQSLFWWIGDGGGRAESPKSWVTRCFNPCSGGLEMAARLRWLVLLASPRFQSLFWWIGDGGNLRNDKVRKDI